MQTAHRTDAGLVRLINEDRAAVRDEWNGFTLAIVADGMGGHQAGEIASQMTIELVETEMRAVTTDLSVDERKQAVHSAIAKANEQVFEIASGQARYQGMGTTVVAALATADDLVIGHIGDSRAYIVSGDSIRQVTEDHSLVNELIKSGQITQEEANIHPLRNVVTRALGTDRQVEIDIIHSPWGNGDVLLLCSDGLSGLVGEREIYEIVVEQGDLPRKVDKLVGRALEEGGGDNITVVLLANDTAANDRERRGGA
ncbi:Stp1/IreP family PP2C-type Ser/Thr phosphatase [Paenibacillus hodogayensis]|uniref:Stp1/IreP family PP2C-type Ser/Thr phosphatase n=1 Tax=Paenibacillus hodogayensis TaxID=279208 RepID=A0ABV5VP02_9BACL